MAYTVYILKSEKDGKLYIGQSQNFAMRLEAHLEGKIRSTKNRRPLKLVHTEQYNSRSEAMLRERELKSVKMRDFKRDLREDTIG